MPRRAYGTGSIQQIREGYWRLTVSAGRDPETGKRRRVVRYVRGSRRQAEQELRELLDEIGDAPPPPRAYTVADLLDDWFREMESDWAAQTRMVREADVRHLKRLLGAIRLLDLTPRAVQAAVDRMREQGYAPRTIHRRMTALRGALRRAMELGMIRRDPMMGVRLPKLPPKQPRILTQDQVASLVQAAQSTRWGLAILLAAHTGMRTAEILGLRWSDIDWERGLIRVEQIVTYRKGGGINLQPHPKSPSSRRIVAIDEAVLRLLRQHRRRQAEERLRAGPKWQDHGLVFPARDGRPGHPGSVDSAIRSIRKRLGLPSLRLHDLRHTHASQLLAAGWSPADVAERLGHSSPAITLGIYAHALPGRQEELVRRGIGTNLAPIPGLDAGESNQL